MFTINNIIKSIIVCATVNTLAIFYISSSVFQQQSIGRGEGELNKIEAFIRAAEITVDFWPHMYKGWVLPFSLSVCCCVIVLYVARDKTPNK